MKMAGHKKDASENLNTRNSTSRRFLTGILSKNSELKPNLSSKRSREWSSRLIRSRINMSKIQDCQRNSSPMILIGNQVIVKLRNNFTRHHLITHSNSTPLSLVTITNRRNHRFCWTAFYLLLHMN